MLRQTLVTLTDATFEEGYRASQVIYETTEITIDTDQDLLDHVRQLMASAGDLRSFQWSLGRIMGILAGSVMVPKPKEQVSKDE